MGFGRRDLLRIRRLALGFRNPRLDGLRGLQIRRDRTQHLLGVVAQGDRVHAVSGRRHGLGEGFPLLQDGFDVLQDEIG